MGQFKELEAGHVGIDYLYRPQVVAQRRRGVNR